MSDKEALLELLEILKKNTDALKVTRVTRDGHENCNHDDDEKRNPDIAECGERIEYAKYTLSRLFNQFKNRDVGQGMYLRAINMSLVNELNTYNFLAQVLRDGEDPKEVIKEIEKSHKAHCEGLVMLAEHALIAQKQ